MGKGPAPHGKTTVAAPTPRRPSGFEELGNLGHQIFGWLKKRNDQRKQESRNCSHKTDKKNNERQNTAINQPRREKTHKTLRKSIYIPWENGICNLVNTRAFLKPGLGNRHWHFISGKQMENFLGGDNIMHDPLKSGINNTKILSRNTYKCTAEQH